MTQQQKQADTTAPAQDQAHQLFDAITEAAYHGSAFRNVLRNDPQALQAAQALAARLKAHHLPQ